ncbi:uncharacterized protein LOC135217900 [Macrobrachium nipponense]|uniref:uncharacterized protein LOC135217900 n=1 Tax=Macrobrachium nipponense TaxID=159736 RepID=UPI0030C875E2
MPKRKTTFNYEWTTEFGFISKSRNGYYYALCTVCHCDMDIGGTGKIAIERQAASAKHKTNTRSAGTLSVLSYFCPSRLSQDDKIMAADLCKVFHAVKHYQSYRSVDCGVKVDKEIYSDSLIVKGATCGKTKTKALCENILAPYSVETHLEYIKEHGLPFSIATDASNKGATKCFPILLRYFHFEKGVQHVLLDFYSDNKESSKAITNQLLSKLETSGLDLNKVSAYTADNANVNYGKHNSVYQKINMAQKNVIAANCLAHILHNTTKFATAKMDIDVENIVLKVNSYFSISAKRTAQLKEFCEFVEDEVANCNLLQHVVTRWLPLLPDIDRMLNCWEVPKSYFQSIGEEESPKVLWKCFGDEGNTCESSEIYFSFLSHTLKLFSDTIERLEVKTFSITSVFKLISELKSKLDRRANYRFLALQ